MRTAPVTATLLTAAVLGLSGCGAVTTTSCSAVRCSATVASAKTVTIKLGSLERSVRVGEIDQRGVALSVRGAEQYVLPGRATSLGGLRIGVVRIDGRTVELDVTRG